jgi:hypothetical protein
MAALEELERVFATDDGRSNGLTRLGVPAEPLRADP